MYSIKQQEVKMKTVSETVKEVDAKKRQLEQQVDHLNEECAKLNTKGFCLVLICK